MSAENEITKFNQRWDARFAAVEDAAALFDQKAQTLENRYGDHVYTGDRTIRVGTGKDFETLPEAIDSLRARARPYVEIILDDGVHEFDDRVSILFGGTNGITIRSDSNNPHQCTLRVGSGGFGRSDVTIRDAHTVIITGITIERTGTRCYVGSVGLRAEQAHVRLGDVRFIGPYDVAVAAGQNSSITSASANDRGVVVEGARIALSVENGATHCQIAGAGLIAHGQHAADAQGQRKVERYNDSDLLENSLASYGVLLAAPCRVRLSSDSVIDGFHVGYEVRNNGSLNGSWTTVRNCYMGVRALNRGHIVVEKISVENSHMYGIFAERGSAIAASEAVVDGIADSEGNAFRSYGGSTVLAGSSTARNAPRGYVAQVSSNISAWDTSGNMLNVTTPYEPPLSETADDGLGIIGHS